MPKASFNKQQKIGLSVLLFFTVLIIAMWYWQLQKNIVYPLYGGIDPKELAKQTATQAVAVDDKTKDTDKDGLTDYLEINVYHTSPYLADTDGDGIPDGTEVKNGTDPNCPEGKVCNGSIVPTTGGELYQSGAATSSQPSGNQINMDVINQLNQVQTPITSAQTGGSGLTKEGAAAIRKAFGDTPDPGILRQKFLEATTRDQDKQLINNMTDAQLLQVYQIMISTN